VSTDSDKTEELGKAIGSRLKGGEVIELASDLGGGKTTFTRGIVEGCGSGDHVSSPTFTVSKIYKTKKFSIHHFDFYRLHEPGIISHELAELIGDNNQVIVIEWADIVEGILPSERIKIRFKSISETERNITITCPKELSYIVDGVEK
jgi:tRNA threonylcarbamoyladenosine biosynthesis protein TsaE